MYPVVTRRNQNWLPGIFSDLFDDNFTLIPARQFASPAVNIKESAKDFQIEIAAPGMTKDDFKIHVNNNEELVIALERKSEKENKDEKDGTYLRREFSYASYHQSFTLPENIDVEGIGAKMQDGVLKITLPKKTEQKQIPAKRQISIG
jgi:HSP20 family protein